LASLDRSVSIIRTVEVHDQDDLPNRVNTSLTPVRR
jgi:hypothetical protein